MTVQISRSNAFNNIPPRKAISARESTLAKCLECSVDGQLNNCCEKCYYINDAKSRFEMSNIPIMYWDLSMNKDFWGDPVLLKKYKDITLDLHKTYNDGLSICFAGPHGVGKTLTVTNILKKAACKGYTCLYTTLSDIVATIISAPPDQKFKARKELCMVDYLVIDEFDSRHMTSGAGADLYGRQLEHVFRRRAENGLPTFMCTNSPQVLDAFDGPIKQSVSSLMNYVETVTVLGKDGRKAKKGNA